MKYAYPAIFTIEESGLVSVCFPDIEGCYTSGKNIVDAVEMAADALCLMLYDMEEDNKEIPSASDITTFDVSDGFVSMIVCDTLEYRKMYDNKAVKKTLTIPAWLNTIAERNNVNFSAVLQQALMKQLEL